MNKRTYRLLSLVLAPILVFSAIGSVSFSAAELQESAVPTQAESTEPQELAAVGAGQNEIAPAAATEAPTEDPTVAPTQAPTEEPAPTVGKVKNITRDSYDSDRCLLN